MLDIFLYVIQTKLPSLPLFVARSLLPPYMVPGASVNSVHEAEVGIRGGIADYIGIGPMWDTTTKKLILDVLHGMKIKSVVIGTYHGPCVCISCY